MSSDGSRCMKMKMCEHEGVWRSVCVKIDMLEHQEISREDDHLTSETYITSRSGWKPGTLARSPRFGELGIAASTKIDHYCADIPVLGTGRNQFWMSLLEILAWRPRSDPACTRCFVTILCRAVHSTSSAARRTEIGVFNAVSSKVLGKGEPDLWENGLGLRVRVLCGETPTTPARIYGENLTTPMRVCVQRNGYNADARMCGETCSTGLAQTPLTFHSTPLLSPDFVLGSKSTFGQNSRSCGSSCDMISKHTNQETCKCWFLFSKEMCKQ